jgi:hypothetical protein
VTAAEYSYLWDGSSDDWVLLRTAETESGEPSYLAANIAERNALIIEDDAIYAEVIGKMLEHGCRVMTPEEWNRK